MVSQQHKEHKDGEDAGQQRGTHTPAASSPRTRAGAGAGTRARAEARRKARPDAGPGAGARTSARTSTPRAANGIPEERILDAAYELLLAIGMSRMNMADIARHAGISRATLYRRWPNVRAVIAALMTREFASLSARFANPEGDGRETVVRAVVRLTGELRAHPMVRKILDVDPEFLIPYLFRRRGTSTNEQLALVEAGIRTGHEDGSIREGDPAMLARAVLLTAMSFTLSGPVFVPESRLPALDAELSELIGRYLAP